MHDLFECFAELWVEDRIDDGIDKAVDVAQPGGEYKDGNAWPPVYVEHGTDGICDITREERHPTNQENTCEKRIKEIIYNLCLKIKLLSVFFFCKILTSPSSYL